MLSHTVVGAAALSVVGFEPGTEPAFLAGLVGSLAPDFDIIYQLKGDYSYLKNHRGFSHSITGLFAISLIITAGAFFINPQWDSRSIFLAAFIGTLSHIFMDIFNSYGVSLFWPVMKRKVTFSLLTIFDPIIFIFSLLVIGIPVSNIFKGIPAISGFILYLLFRVFQKSICVRKISRNSKDLIYKKIVVMPSFFSILIWDFIILSDDSIVVGKISPFAGQEKVNKVLRNSSCEVKKFLLSTKFGRFFTEFSPLTYVQYENDHHGIKAKFVDLRYFVKNRFLHNGTIILDKNLDIVESIFHPYTPNRNVIIQ